MGAVTIFAILTWYFTPEDKWLKREQILRGLGEYTEGNREEIRVEGNRDSSN